MGGGDGVVTLRYWNGFEGPDGRTMLRLVQRFNHENPDVHVVMQRMAWAQYYNKLFVAGLGGRAPDVFVTHRSALQRFVGGGFVRPVDDFVGVAPDQLNPADFDATILSAVKQGETTWAVPLDVHLEGMYFNRARFAAARVANPPTNRDEFVDAVRRMKSADTWGFAFTWQRNNVYSIMRQFGGEVFDKSLTRATFSDERNVAALDWCVQLIRDKLAPEPKDMDPWIGFRQGKIAIAHHGIFMLPDLEKQKDLDWGAAPLATIGPQPAAWGDSHSLCVRKDLDPQRVAAAKRLIKFLSDNSLDWAAGGQVPVRKSLRDSERFRGMYAQSQFAKQIDHVAFFPPTPFIFEYFTEFDLAVELALRQDLSPRDALAQADVKVQRVIDRYQAAGGAA
jgi:multiple sugar transport system substrate-binding protein